MKKKLGRNVAYHDVTATTWRPRRKERWKVAYQIISPTSKDRRFGALEEVSSIQELGVQQEQRNLRQALGRESTLYEKKDSRRDQPTRPLSTLLNDVLNNVYFTSFVGV